MKQVSVRELAGLGAALGTTPLLLDVREPWEHETAHIALAGHSSVLMPMNSVPARLGELDRAQPVVCICHHGARSAQVVAFLEREGFDAFNLAGGIDAWSVQVDAGVPRY